jgi:hypothetical protein
VLSPDRFWTSAPDRWSPEVIAKLEAALSRKAQGAGPPLALPLPGGGRAYRNPVTGRVVPSVTTVLKILAKPELEAWKLRQVAEAAVEHYGHLGRLMADVSFEEAVQRLARVPDQVAERAAKRGTAVHAYAEAWAKGEPLPELVPEHEGYLRAFCSFVNEWRPVFTGAEVTVWAEEAGYAGTLDAWAVVEVEGRLVVADWKTSKTVHPEAALQLAALANAPEVVHPDGRREPAPKVEGGLIVRLGADGNFEVVPVDVGADSPSWCAFRALVEVWWVLQGHLVNGEEPLAKAIAKV